ncbi:MAG: SHOCT domain-containing protein [Acidimicrobiales bacterium]
MADDVEAIGPVTYLIVEFPGNDAQQQYAPPPPSPAPAALAADPIEQLKDLAELKAQGILTEADFEAQKARILGS